MVVKGKGGREERGTLMTKGRAVKFFEGEAEKGRKGANEKEVL